MRPPKRYRARCWRRAGKHGDKRLLMATLIVEADSPDEASHLALDRISSADYVELEAAPLEHPPAA